MYSDIEFGFKDPFLGDPFFSVGSGDKQCFCAHAGWKDYYSTSDWKDTRRQLSSESPVRRQLASLVHDEPIVDIRLY